MFSGDSESEDLRVKRKVLHKKKPRPVERSTSEESLAQVQIRKPQETLVTPEHKIVDQTEESTNEDINYNWEGVDPPVAPNSDGDEQFLSPMPNPLKTYTFRLERAQAQAQPSWASRPRRNHLEEATGRRSSADGRVAHDSTDGDEQVLSPIPNPLKTLPFRLEHSQAQAQPSSSRRNYLEATPGRWVSADGRVKIYNKNSGLWHRDNLVFPTELSEFPPDPTQTERPFSATNSVPVRVPAGSGKQFYMKRRPKRERKPPADYSFGNLDCWAPHL